MSISNLIVGNPFKIKSNNQYLKLKEISDLILFCIVDMPFTV